MFAVPGRREPVTVTHIVPPVEPAAKDLSTPAQDMSTSARLAQTQRDLAASQADLTRALQDRAEAVETRAETEAAAARLVGRLLYARQEIARLRARVPSCVGCRQHILAGEPARHTVCPTPPSQGGIDG